MKGVPLCSKSLNLMRMVLSPSSVWRPWKMVPGLTLLTLHHTSWRLWAISPRLNLTFSVQHWMMRSVPISISRTTASWFWPMSRYCVRKAAMIHCLWPLSSPRSISLPYVWRKLRSYPILTKKMPGSSGLSKKPVFCFKSCTGQLPFIWPICGR